MPKTINIETVTFADKTVILPIGANVVEAIKKLSDSKLDNNIREHK